MPRNDNLIPLFVVVIGIVLALSGIFLIIQDENVFYKSATDYQIDTLKPENVTGTSAVMRAKIDTSWIQKVKYTIHETYNASEFSKDTEWLTQEGGWGYGDMVIYEITGLEPGEEYTYSCRGEYIASNTIEFKTPSDGEPEGPSAGFHYDTDDLSVDLESDAQGGTNEIDTIQWDVDGDGSWDETGSYVNHDYESKGKYEVTQKVTDQIGMTDQVTKTIEVENMVHLIAYTDEGGSTDPCIKEYGQGTTVDVEAIPDSGWQFDRWTGDVESESNPVSITLDTDYRIKAVFEQVDGGEENEYHLTTSIESGAGSINPTDRTFSAGTEIMVEANPDEESGFAFDHWGGGVSGTSNPITVTMNSDKHIEAYFSKTQLDEVVVSTSSNPNNGGKVIVNKTGTASLGSVYEEGTKVNIIASPNEGFRFTGWGGDVTGDDDKITNYELLEDTTVIANFEEKRSPIDLLAMSAPYILLVLGSVMVLMGYLYYRS